MVEPVTSTAELLSIFTISPILSFIVYAPLSKLHAHNSNHQLPQVSADVGSPGSDVYFTSLNTEERFDISSTCLFLRNKFNFATVNGVIDNQRRLCLKCQSCSDIKKGEYVIQLFTDSLLSGVTSGWSRVAPMWYLIIPSQTRPLS